MSIQFNTFQYRAYRRPVEIILQLLNIDFQVQINEFKNNIKQISVKADRDANYEGFVQINQYLQQYIEQNQKQAKNVQTSLQIEQISQFYDSVIEEITQKQEQFNIEQYIKNTENILCNIWSEAQQEANIIQQCCTLKDSDEFVINTLKKQKEQCCCANFTINEENKVQCVCSLGNKVSLSELIIYETIKFVFELFGQNWDILGQSLNKFVINIERQSYIQPFLFSNANLVQDFLPSLKNSNNIIKNTIENQLGTFIHLANQSGAQYVFKGKNQDNKELIYTDHVPFSPKPIILRKKELDEFSLKGKLWNKLLNNMANDQEFIDDIFKNMNDEYLQKHLKIWDKVKQTPESNQLNFTVTRNDVMFDSQSQNWFQIEYNTHAVSFAHISDTIQDLQQAIKNSYFKEELKNYEHRTDKSGLLVVDSLIEAHKIYNVENSIMIMVVEEFEGNSYDQIFIEYQLALKGYIMKRKSFRDIYAQGSINPENNALIVDGEEVSIVYYRSGYAPDQYKGENCWKAREMVELSRAIKCPNIKLSLINFKKAQQALQNDDILRRFVDTEEEVQQIKQNFVKIYDFENESSQESLVKQAQMNMDDYVLKPQREGGANNYYGADVCKMLCGMDKEERKNYILMQKIKPQPQCGFLIKQRKLEVTAIICEYGILGTFIGEAKGKNKMLNNEINGYLVRSKKYFENEGGVASGYAVIDSVMHFNNKQ